MKTSFQILLLLLTSASLWAQPTAICQNRTLYLNASGLATLSAIDIGGSSINATNFYLNSVGTTTLSFNCNHLGANAVTMIAEDAGGLQSSCTATVTVMDTLAPTALCQLNLSKQLNATGVVTVFASQLNNASTDNCGISLIKINGQSSQQYNCANVGNNAATLSVYDLSGNVSTCMANITVSDNTSPVALCKTSITVYLDANGTAVVQGNQLDNGSSDNCAIVGFSINGQSSQIYTQANLGLNPALMQVSDGNNTEFCSSVVNVLDTFPAPCGSPDVVPPLALCQSNVVLSLPSTGNIVVTPAMLNNSSSDNCGIANMLVNGQSSLTLDCSNLGNNSLTLSVIDLSGNSSSCSAPVYLADNIAPAQVCHTPTVYLNASGLVTVSPQQLATATDACTLVNWQVDGQNQLLMNCADIGTHLVLVSVEDIFGNYTSCTAALTVLDSTAPAPLCNNLVVPLAANNTIAIDAVDVYGAGSTDNCFVDSIWVSQPLFDCQNVGNNLVQLYARDASGNIGSCTAIIEILDTVLPVAICQNVSLYLDANGSATLQASQIDNGSSDNCSIVNVMADNQSSLLFSCVDLGVHPTILTVWDNQGNAATCSSDVTVLDTFTFCPVLGHLVAVQAVSCDSLACIGAAEVEALGGVPPYFFSWSNGGTTALLSGLCVGVYSVTISDANADTAVVNNIVVGYSNGCVWPGDTDDNTVVDNMDVLPIALAFGDIGLPRPNATTNWQGQSAPDWNTALPGLPDHKHLDADGDGQITNNDVNVVAANYGQNYLRSNNFTSLTGNIPFYADSVSANEGANVSVPIRLGKLTELADSVYAIAFTVEYSPILVQAGSTSVTVGNSWLGNDLIQLYHEHAGIGRLDVVVGRKDHQPITGFGEVITFHTTIIEDVLRLNPDSFVCMPIELTNVRLIDHQNTTKGTKNMAGEVCIRVATGITAPNPLASSISVYPNPTDNLCTLISNDAAMQKLDIYDALGRLVDSRAATHPQQWQLSLAHLPTGCYQLQIHTALGIQRLRVVRE